MVARTAPVLPPPEMLARLVELNTVSGQSNLNFIGFVRAWLDQHGVFYRLSYDTTGRKANLHAIIGPVRSGGLAFSGHVDTVSVDGQQWTGNPFTLRRHDGRLIGRGACDMKGFLAAMLSAVPRLSARTLTEPVHLLFTYDEEIGYHGARRLIEDFAESGLWPAACVVGEASNMRPIIANKGRRICRIHVNGLPTHSSAAHRGMNAAHAAAEAAAWIAAESRRLSLTTGDPDFEPPYTTVQVGSFVCDTLPNTIPGRAHIDVEIRNIPSDSPDDLLTRFRAYVAAEVEPRMREVQASLGFEYEELLDLAALSLPSEHRLARAVSDVTGVQVGGKVSYCSEGSLYQPAGIASVVCGPGDVKQAHQPDEWIAESQLHACSQFIQDLVDRLAA